MLVFVTTTLAFWMTMNTEAAIAGTVAYVIAVGFWYKHCERIYRRFYWNADDESGWEPGASEIERFEEDDPFEKSANNDMNKPKSSFEKPKGKRRRSLLTYVFGSGNKLYEEAAVEELRRDSIATDMINGSSSNWSPQDREQRSSSVTSSPVSFIPLSGPAANSAWASTSTSRGIVMEGYLTTRGGRTQKKFIDFGGDEPWERRYFTLNATSCLFIYKTRHDYRTDVRSTLYTRPLRLGDFYIEVSNSDHAERSGLPEQETYSEVSGTMSFSETAAYKTIASINNLIAPADIDIKPDRFQMILVPRENAERQSEITVLGSGASSKSVANPLHAQSSSTRYRDHWVLRCDTEEELQQWVSVMRDLCPSCFNVDNV